MMTKFRVKLCRVPPTGRSTSLRTILWVETAPIVSFFLISVRRDAEYMLSLP